MQCMDNVKWHEEDVGMLEAHSYMKPFVEVNEIVNSFQTYVLNIEALLTESNRHLRPP